MNFRTMGTGSDKKNSSTAGPNALDDFSVGDSTVPVEDDGKVSLASKEYSSKTADSAQAQFGSAHSGTHTGIHSGQAHTSCPNCQTLFEVSPELLTSDDTRVRCGECLSIFDSLSNLRDDDFPDDANDELLLGENGNILDTDSSYARAMPLEKDDFTASGDYSGLAGIRDASATATADYADEALLDVTYSDFDLFSGEAGLPEVAYFDETQDSSGLRFDETEADETLSDTLFSHDLTVDPVESTFAPESSTEELERIALDTSVNFVTDDVPRDPLVFKYRDGDDRLAAKDPEPALQNSVGMTAGPAVTSTTTPAWYRTAAASWLMRSVLVVVLFVIVVGLYSYRSRDALMRNPDVRPWLVNACAILGCHVPALVDLGALKVVKRSVFSHPTIDNALVIDLAFVNEAEFVQPYPVLEIRLTDRKGSLVVRTDVEPADYLDTWQSSDLLAVGERLDLSLTVADPGQTATSFELNFR